MNYVSWKSASALVAIAACCATAQAADWSDTSIGYRYGTDFAEPFNAKKISKDILNLNDHRNLALIYGDLGDNDNAFYYLDLGFERKDVSFTSIKIDPKFDHLRKDPRFNELIKKMKFPG